MIPKVFELTKTNKHIIEVVLEDEQARLTHVVLEPKQGFDAHKSDANLYLTVLKGKITVKVEDNEPVKYEAGKVLNVPKGILMKLDNLEAELLEIIVFKSPIK